MPGKSVLLALCGAMAALLLSPRTGVAQEPNFYRDKQIRLVIGWSPGGDYDLGARLVAKYWSHHIPGNPAIVPQNMPGAISINAANYVFTVAPKDGTVIGVFGRNLPAQAMLGQANMRFDPRRFGWIGGAGFPSHICVALTTSPVTRAEDLFTHELLMAGIGASSSPSLIPEMLNQLLGTKFKLVRGYASSSDVVLALKRGEVSGLCHSAGFFRNLYADLLTDGIVRPLLRIEESAGEDFPQLPSAFSFAETDEQRQMMRFLTASAEFGRPFVLPPDAPAERLALLRRSLAETLADPDLLQEAAHLKLDVSARSGEALQQLVDNLYATPKPLIDRAAKLMPSD